MTTMPDEVRARPTLASAPERWAGPSFLWSTPGPSGWQLIAGGWRWRGTDWEHRFTDAGLLDGGSTSTPWGWSGHRLDLPTAEPAVQDDQAEELEVIIDASPDQAGYLAMPGLHEALAAVLGAAACHELADLPSPGAVSITRNRPLLTRSAAGLRVADVRFSTLPYGHGDSRRPIQFASRWLRLATTDNALVALWAPLEGRWRPDEIRWPHHAVPSRRVASLQTAARPAGVDDRLACLLADCLQHEQYYLDTWQMELEAWEADVYTSLAAGEAVLKDLDLSDPVRASAGSLAVFLSRTQLDLRALRRRSEVDPLFAGQHVQQILQTGLAQAAMTQSVNQQLRREAFSLLTSIASGEQLQAARDQADAAHAQQRATEGLQQTIAWVTALLLAPTVVIGVFGANLHELADGAKATLVQLGQWALLAAGVSMSVLWWRTPPATRRRWLGIVPVLLGVAAVVGGLVLWSDGRPGDGLLWAAGVTAWCTATLVALLRPARRPVRRRPWSRRRETAAWT